MAIARKIPNTTNRLAANPKRKHFQKAAIQQHFHNNNEFFLGRYHLPLSASDQERIVSAFELPAPAAWALSAKFSHFQRYSQSSSNRIGQYPNIVFSKIQRTVD
jgi:hypothetical protein